jgi:exopolysaccharide biosynthesis protein
VYSEGGKGHPVLYINQRNEISFDKPIGKIYNAISGDQLLVSKGVKVKGLENTRFDPRTAFGISQNGRWIYLVVVDGREASAGLSFDELADLLLSFGAYTATSFDGGGSSTMVIEGFDGQPRIVNTVIDDNIPGRERAVANHLGIGFKK